MARKIAFLIRGYAPHFLSGACVVLVLIISVASTAFRQCYAESKTPTSYQKYYESPPGFMVSVFDWFALCVRCEGRFIDENQGGITAVATIGIAVFTFVLWKATRNLWREAEAQRRDAKDALEIQIAAYKVSIDTADRSAKAAERAANASERALTEHERPWVFREAVSVIWRDPETNKINDWFVSLQWKNVGRTPALLRDFRFKFTDLRKLPDNPDYSDTRQLGTVSSLAVDGDFETNRVGPVQGVDDEGRPIEYVFYGYLEYAEMNGKQHRSGFAIRLSPHFPAATVHNSDAYNYYT